METRYLLTLTKILETGSFQNAANDLGYTASTITFHIRQLEEEFNIKLFEQIGRKMVLTQAGKDIMPYVHSVLQYVSKIKDYGEEANQLKGDLKVAMPETILVYQMQPVLKEFRLRAPDVNLSLQSYNCYTISNYILNGMIDIGIYYDVDDRNPSYVEEVLGKYKTSLIASPDLPNINQISSLSDYSLIVNDDYENICRNKILAILNNQHIKPRNILELSSFEAIKRSVSNNIGFSYVPSFIIEEELKEGQLKELSIGLPEDIITVLCVHHKNKWVTPAMSLFMQLTREHMKNH